MKLERRFNAFLGALTKIVGLFGAVLEVTVDHFRHVGVFWPLAVFVVGPEILALRRWLREFIRAALKDEE